MILKLNKVPDKTIFKAVFAMLILWNLKYFFLIFQIPFTMLFMDYVKQNGFYTQVSDIRNAVKDVKDFQDEGVIGFVSDTPQASVFDIQESIRDFYLAQYAAVPSILKNDTEHKYVIGSFDRVVKAPNGFKILKKINGKTYLYKRIDK